MAENNAEEMVNLGQAGTQQKDITTEPFIEVENDVSDFFIYDIHEAPSIILTVMFALQQVLISLSRSLSTALLVADVVCARMDEPFKATLLSTTLLTSGLCTFLQNTIGIRLPLYQGPSATYVVPLLALASLPEWKCPDITVKVQTMENNLTMNYTDVVTDLKIARYGVMIDKTQKLEGSLMIAGLLHMMVGLTGMVAVLIRFIGPVVVVPPLTLTGLVVYKATVNFASTQWGIALLTTGLAMIFSFYLQHQNAPIPMWNSKRGLHIRWSPIHKMFSVLISCTIAWGLSAILTEVGVFSDNPNSTDYFARTDSRLNVIQETSWFIFPYPGQFGLPKFETGAFVTFILGTITSIIDSIGDYYACAKVCRVPPPPSHAVNRGIAVEGFVSFLGGWTGAGHATSTFGGNIGAIGLQAFVCFKLSVSSTLSLVLSERLVPFSSRYRTALSVG